MASSIGSPNLPAGKPEVAADENRPDSGVGGKRCGDVYAVSAGEDFGQVRKVRAADPWLYRVVPDKKLKIKQFLSMMYASTGRGTALELSDQNTVTTFVSFAIPLKVERNVWYTMVILTHILVILALETATTEPTMAA